MGYWISLSPANCCPSPNRLLILTITISKVKFSYVKLYDCPPMGISHSTQLTKDLHLYLDFGPQLFVIRLLNPSSAQKPMTSPHAIFHFFTYKVWLHWLSSSQSQFLSYGPSISLMQPSLISTNLKSSSYQHQLDYISSMLQSFSSTTLILLILWSLVCSIPSFSDLFRLPSHWVCHLDHDKPSRSLSSIYVYVIPTY